MLLTSLKNCYFNQFFLDKLYFLGLSVNSTSYRNICKFLPSNDIDKIISYNKKMIAIEACIAHLVAHWLRDREVHGSTLDSSYSFSFSYSSSKLTYCSLSWVRSRFCGQANMDIVVGDIQL